MSTAALTEEAPRRRRRGRRRARKNVDRARLPPNEVFGVALQGLRTRKLRAALSALGIAIGIGAMVAVVGVSASAQANLIAEIDSLGTNLLTVSPGTDFLGNNAVLPITSVPMIAHMPNVERDAAIYGVSENVYRTPYVPAEETGGLGVDAAGDNLPQVVSTGMASGHFLTALSNRYPQVVLGSAAAQNLQILTVRRPRDGLSGQHLVHRDRDPQTVPARLVTEFRGVHLAAGRRASLPDIAEPDRNLRAQHPERRHPCLQPVAADRQSTGLQWRQHRAGRPTCSKPEQPPRASSQRCC